MPRKPPPEGKRFKPGQSGNPAGRPKSVLRSLLLEFMEGTDEGEKDSRALKFIRATYDHAIKGNAQCGTEIWNRLDGKVKDELDLRDKSPRPPAGLEALKGKTVAQLEAILKGLEKS